jgi:hypothetical protein
MSAIDQHGIRFDPSFSHAEDYDFFDRIGNVSKLMNIQRPLYRIRIHGSSVSRIFDEVQRQNSDRVKMRIFKRIGLSITSHELKLFSHLMYQDYGLLLGSGKQDLVHLLNQLIETNNKSEYLPKEFLRHELAVRVLHMCNQLAKNDEGVFGALMNFSHFRSIDGIGLFGRTLLKVIIGSIRQHDLK